MSHSTPVDCFHSGRGNTSLKAGGGGVFTKASASKEETVRMKEAFIRVKT